MLAGNATADSRELARFLRAGGAGSIVGVMDAQLALLGERRGGSSPSAAAGASAGAAAREHADGAAPVAALTQALVALCSVAGSSRGAAALVAAGEMLSRGEGGCRPRMGTPLPSQVPCRWSRRPLCASLRTTSPWPSLAAWRSVCCCERHRGLRTRRWWRAAELLRFTRNCGREWIAE